MNEFTKTKITVSLALLAVLFTINPIVTRIGDAGFSFIWFTLSIWHVYYAFLASMGFAVYFFSAYLIWERLSDTFESIANIFYVTALAIPPAYLVLFILSWFVNNIMPQLSKEAIWKTLPSVISAIAGAFNAFIMFKQIAKRDKKANAISIQKDGSTVLSRASGLIASGFYDLVVIEVFGIIEKMLRSLLIQNGNHKVMGYQPILSELIRMDLLDKETAAQIKDLLPLRNRAVHNTEESISKDEAESALRIGERVLGRLITITNRDDIERDPPKSASQNFKDGNVNNP